ncbi:ASKHA domain-containing protein [soil metagenome]
MLDAARGLGVDLDSVCGGRGLCGRCQVTLGARPGVPADPGRLSPPGAMEAAYRGRRPLTDGRRLGCTAQLLGDAVIDVPTGSQLHHQVVRKDVTTHTLVIDPVVILRYVEVAPAELAGSDGVWQRLRSTLDAQWGVRVDHIDLPALHALQAALHDETGGVTVAVRDGSAVVAVWPGLRDVVYGVAFDVGSTTLAGHLCELGSGRVLASTGRMNPQIGFGEDLMSRVSYAQLHAEGQAQLTAAVREALAAMIVELCATADLDPADVLEISLVGNPVMHHLVFGLDPRPLGTAPFALATTGAVTARADELALGAHPGARVYAPPCIAGHVGADAAAMVLAERPYERDDLTMLVDVGTNAEIVLGNRDRLLAASSPTGPAFEGAQISSGQRAAPGAIERVRIDRETLEPRLKVIGVDVWSDDDGFAAAVDATGVTGICGSGIIEAVAELFLAGVVTADGRVERPADTPRIVTHDRTLAYRLWDDPVIEVTQNDVRAIQLAKAALQAGCRLLMDRLGVTALDRVRLTGAFGSHIDPLYALVLGLVPDCDVGRVEAVGNAAGVGALMLLLSAGARGELEGVAERIVKVETAIEPAFQEHFVAAMAFPHAHLPYDRLAERVTLPAPAPPRARTSRSARRAPRRSNLG